MSYIKTKDAKREWTADEETWLILHWKPMLVKDRPNFEKAFTKGTGRERSYSAMAFRAYEMGLTQTDNVALPKLGAVAEALGVNRKRLREHVLRHPEEYPVVREGRFFFLPEETVEKLREWFKPFTDDELQRTMTIDEAANRLCVVREAIHNFYKYGALKYLRRGQVFRIYRDSVEEVRRLRDRYGKNWLEQISDRLNESYHRDRAQARLRNQVRRNSLTHPMDTPRRVG